MRLPRPVPGTVANLLRLLVLPLVVVACAPADQEDAQTEAEASTTTSFEIERASPTEVGFTDAGIAAIGHAMEALVDSGRVAGVMTLVQRDGKLVHWEADGWRVLGEDPLEPNDVFRIYSMTKPITSTAAMMLVEEGLIDLDAPLTEYLPQFADVRVLDGGELRAPSAPITIRDLLRHTSGMTYGLFGETPVDSIYRREILAVLNPQAGPDLAGITDRIAELPLLADPGTVFNYSVSTDVLGRVVEVASGTDLATFFRARIFEPLGMNETSFHVPSGRLDRFAAVYTETPDGLTMIDSPVDGPFTSEPTWYSGGGGLTSTAMDYLRFARMMLNEGELDGVRILTPQSVQAMSSDQLPEGSGPIMLSPTDNFGLGFAVSVTGPTPGIFWWAGVMNTWFWIDPEEDLIAFVWTQHDPFMGVPVNQMMRSLVYDGLEEPVRAVPAGAAGG